MSVALFQKNRRLVDGQSPEVIMMVVLFSPEDEGEDLVASAEIAHEER